MEFTISRDKNYINFLAEGKEQPYAFDINTGILYSLKSKPLKNFPSGLKSCIIDSINNDFVLCVMGIMLDRSYNFHDSWSWRLADFQECADLLTIADKINSLGYKPTHDDTWRLNKHSLSLIGDNFKAFAKYLSETENDASIFGFLNTVYPALWAEQNGIEVNEIVTLDVCREIMRANFNAEQMEYLLKCFRRGVPYFYMFSDGHINMYGFLETLRHYFAHCEALDIKYDKDFFRGVALANRMYQTHKKEIDNKKIANQLNKHNYDFEDDNFTIVVPQTTEDFLHEAEQQNNCVYNIYMDRVAEGRTNVVFIRRKSNPSKSYITCEISNSGKIRQYLLTNNRRVDRNTPEHDFEIALQNWLNDNWA